MGCFYGSVQIRGNDRLAVQTAIEDLARESRICCWLGPPLDGWIGVYPIGHGQDPSIARALAARLGGDVFQLLVYDDDVFAYAYHRYGKEVDQYSSRPEYFGALPGRARKKLAGRPDRFKHLAVDAAGFDRLRERLSEQEARPAVFASELLTLFASAFAIRNVQTCYEYLSNGEHDVDGWSDFVHIPELGREEAERGAPGAASPQEARHEMLLAAQGGPRGREVPSPYWCPAADGEGFYVVWAPAAYTSLEPVSIERLGPPWTASAVPTGLTCDPTIMQIVLSPTGRHLAITCAGGEPRGTVWSLADRRLVAKLPQGHAAFRFEFLPDESAAVWVGASRLAGEIGILPFGTGEPRFMSLPSTKLAVAHPGGKVLAALDARDRLSIVELDSGKVDRTLFLHGVRPPLEAAFVLGPDYPREWRSMAPGALDDVLAQKQNNLIEVFERQFQGQPSARLDAQRKKARAQVARYVKDAREALARAREPSWLDEKGRSNESVNQLAFDASGVRLFAATSAGLRVYLWRDVVAATTEMPPAAMAVNNDSWLEPGALAAGMQKPGLSALVHDARRDWLLFAGQEGRVRFLDLSHGGSGVLLDVPGRPAIGQLALSRDGSALGLTCDPDINLEGPNRRAAVIQFWDYLALCRSL